MFRWIAIAIIVIVALFVFHVAHEKFGNVIVAFLLAVISAAVILIVPVEFAVDEADYPLGNTVKKVQYAYGAAVDWTDGAEYMHLVGFTPYKYGTDLLGGNKNAFICEIDEEYTGKKDVGGNKFNVYDVKSSHIIAPIVRDEKFDFLPDSYLSVFDIVFDSYQGNVSSENSLQEKEVYKQNK